MPVIPPLEAEGFLWLFCKGADCAYSSFQLSEYISTAKDAKERKGQLIVLRPVIKCVYGSVPRAVASVTHPEARSLPLAVLIRRVFPYTQSRADLSPAFLRYLCG